MSDTSNQQPVAEPIHQEPLAQAPEGRSALSTDEANPEGVQQPAEGAFDENGMRIYEEPKDVAYTVHPLELPTNPAAAARIPAYMIDDTHMSDSPTTGAADLEDRIAAGKAAHGLEPDDESMSGHIPAHERLLAGQPAESNDPSR